MKFGVREQTTLIASIPLVFLLALVAVGSQLLTLTNQSADISRVVADRLARADRVYDSINDLFGDIKEYHKEHLAQTLRRYETTKASIPGELRAVTATVMGDRATEVRAKRFTDNAAAVVSLLDRDFSLMRLGKMAQATALSNLASTRRLGPEYLASKSALDIGERSNALKRIARLRGTLSRLSTSLLLLAIAGTLLTVALAMTFALRTGRRFRRLVANAAALARKEPTLPIQGNDEIAEVDRVYHEMARELEEGTVLQLALLPQSLPQIAGLRLDSAYIPASTYSQVGGDWYDVFPIDDRLLGISIGDVCGHGISAASTTALLRQTMRVAARIERDPSSVLRQANRTLCADDPAALATAFFATFDRNSGSLRWSIAGHPSPLVVRPDQTIAFLDGDGLVLGVDAQASFSDSTCELGVGCALVLYTDGVVEVDRDYLRGVDALVEAVLAEYNESSQNVADKIQRRLFERRAPHDDAAIMFLGVSSLAPEAETKRHVWQLDARNSVSAQRVKRAVIWQLAGLMPEAAEFGAVEAIYGELLANVARHTPGPATVTLEWNDGVPVLHVDDQGPAFQPRIEALSNGNVMAEGGRGFWIISMCASKFAVQRIGNTNRVSVVLPMASGDEAIPMG